VLSGSGRILKIAIRYIQAYSLNTIYLAQVAPSFNTGLMYRATFWSCCDMPKIR